MKEQISSALLAQGLRWVRKNPEKNMIKLADWAEHFVRHEYHRSHVAAYRKAVTSPGSNWHNFIMRIVREVDPKFLERFVRNFVIYSSWIGNGKIRKLRTELDMNVPWAILMDPTSACNLNCIGCWAAEYDKSSSLSYELMDRIITEGKDLGIYMYIYSGGEPLVKKDDIMKLAARHDDTMFAAFTNAVLIDEPFADEIAKHCNFIPIISIEGSEEHTDDRRGKGTYQACLRAMDILRSRKLPFGFSVCYHSKNTEDVGSDAWVDFMVDKGALFGWYFTYIPEGKHADVRLMANPDQREFMYRRIRELRSTKPVFLLDFWNDGEAVEGCIAGGKSYCHINARGEMEPCAFIHYAATSIHDKSLLEALDNPLFREYHRRQPFTCNLLQPCPLLDNPDILNEMVKDSGAWSTQEADREPVEELTGKCVQAAQAWAPVAERLWRESHRE